MASSIFYAGPFGNLQFAASSYLNWGSTIGTSGYGIRDNAGTMEFKASGGSWAAIASAASGGGWQRVGTVVSLVTGSDTLGSNFLPTDATYKLGDATHRWTSLDLSGDLTMGSGEVKLGYYDPGGTGNPRWLRLGDVVSNGDASGSYSSAFLSLQVRETDQSASTGMTTLNLDQYFGYGGVASKGTGGPLNLKMRVQGSGDTSNEFATIVSKLDVEIGTGFTQTTGPASRTWGEDKWVMGPIAVQPNVLTESVLTLNNFYNGSPSQSGSKSAVTQLVTFPGLGSNATHIAADTYAIDAAMTITGYSHHGGVDAVGFTNGIRIGGTATGWGETKSLLGSGIDIRDYATRGIYIHNPTGTPTADIEITGTAILPTVKAGGAVPTIAANFGTNPDIFGTSALSFGMLTGTGAATNVGSLTFAQAAPIGWHCSVADQTGSDTYVQAASASSQTTIVIRNYSRTTGLPVNWPDNEYLSFSCTPY